MSYDLTVEQRLVLTDAVLWAVEEARKPKEECAWIQDRWVTPRHLLAQYGRAESCGTAFCIAGRMAFTTTGNLRDSKAENIALAFMGAYDDRELHDVLEGMFEAGNTIEQIVDRAEEILGYSLDVDLSDVQVHSNDDDEPEDADYIH